MPPASERETRGLGTDSVVCGHDRQVFDQRLGYQQSIEGVPVKWGQFLKREDIFNANREQHDAIRALLIADQPLQWQRQLQLTEADPDLHRPNAGDAEEVVLPL